MSSLGEEDADRINAITDGIPAMSILAMFIGEMVFSRPKHPTRTVLEPGSWTVSKKKSQ
jgi:hypothetical protein